MDLSQPNLWIVASGAILAWWASTGLILVLVARSEATYRWSMLGGIVASLAAVIAAMTTKDITTVGAALTAFGAAVVIWGTIELAFLTGYVVGPIKAPCPEGLSAWPRFRISFWALAHHEFALAAGILLLWLLVRDAPNQLSYETFVLLWVMRLSTKLNIFLGVANITEEFLPARIHYLKSYFRKAPMNALFPIAVTAATVLVVVLGQKALSVDATPFAAVSAMLLATFAALAVIEHWMLVVPFPSSVLWPWASHPTADDDARSVPSPKSPAARRSERIMNH